jgi:hypothetical protein
VREHLEAEVGEALSAVMGAFEIELNERRRGVAAVLDAKHAAVAAMAANSSKGAGGGAGQGGGGGGAAVAVLGRALSEEEVAWRQFDLVRQKGWLGC